jgi:hypothetical protein
LPFRPSGRLAGDLVLRWRAGRQDDVAVGVP